MSIGTLPGFSGEASLYESSRSYVSKRVPASDSEGVVVPAAFFCGGMCLLCAAALLDPIPGDEFVACAICAGCVGPVA